VAFRCEFRSFSICTMLCSHSVTTWWYFVFAYKNKGPVTGGLFSQDINEDKHLGFGGDPRLEGGSALVSLTLDRLDVTLDVLPLVIHGGLKPMRAGDEVQLLPGHDIHRSQQLLPGLRQGAIVIDFPPKNNDCRATREVSPQKSCEKPKKRRLTFAQ